MKRKKSTSFKFRPFSRKQKKLLMWWTDKSPYKDYDMIICHGSIRSGKTVAMIDSFVTWSLAKHQHQNFIIAGKSMGALKRNVLEPMFQILTAKGIDYHYHRSGDPYVQIGTNTYYLFGANNEASQDTLQGLTAAGAYLDEVALFPRSFVDQAIGRCSAETNGNGGKVFVNCNPAGPYHWFKTEFIDKAKEKKIFDLHFTMNDNLSLSERVKQRFYRIYSGVFFQRYILGLWVLAEGIIYDMFNEEEHVIDEWPNDIHDYQVAIDYGTKNPTAFVLQGIHYDTDGIATYYNLKEYFYDGRAEGKQKTDNTYYDDLETFCAGYTNEVIIDPSAASFIALIEEKGVLSVTKADNAVLDGIRTVSRLISERRCLTHRDCVNLLRERSSYVWDEKASNRGEDKPVKDFDHVMDAERYGIYTKENRGVRLDEYTAALMRGARVHG